MDYVEQGRGCSARTRNNYRGWLSGLCAYFTARAWMEHNPVAEIPKERAAPKKRCALTAEALSELRRHLELVNPHFLLACMMQYYTLLRPNELSHLRICDISVRDMSIFMDSSHSKNGRSARVAINRRLLEMMLSLNVLTLPPEWYLFGRGLTPGPDRGDPDMFNKRWKYVRRALRWPDSYQFYSLKDSGIRDLAEGRGIITARDQARHSDISTTNIYLQDRNLTAPDKAKDFDGLL